MIYHKAWRLMVRGRVNSYSANNATGCGYGYGFIGDDFDDGENGDGQGKGWSERGGGKGCTTGGDSAFWYHSDPHPPGCPLNVAFLLLHHMEMKR
jgi:hypothetical protein